MAVCYPLNILIQVLLLYMNYISNLYLFPLTLLNNMAEQIYSVPEMGPEKATPQKESLEIEELKQRLEKEGKTGLCINFKVVC